MAYFSNIGDQTSPDHAQRSRFSDRRQAGRALARALSWQTRNDDLLVLALPRGGVPVAASIAEALGACLDVMLVRKLGVPGRTELALGAVASGDITVLNADVVESLAIGDATIERVRAVENAELKRREHLYRANRAAPSVEEKTVILVDDGLATGATMRAAVAALRRRGPRRVVVAVPVAPAPTCEQLRKEADEVVCLATPEPFVAIGTWYEEFGQVSDDEVARLLDSCT